MVRCCPGFGIEGIPVYLDLGARLGGSPDDRPLTIERVDEQVADTHQLPTALRRLASIGYWSNGEQHVATHSDGGSSVRCALHPHLSQPETPINQIKEFFFQTRGEGTTYEPYQ